MTYFMYKYRAPGLISLIRFPPAANITKVTVSREERIRSKDYQSTSIRGWSAPQTEYHWGRAAMTFPRLWGQQGNNGIFIGGRKINSVSQNKGIRKAVLLIYDTESRPHSRTSRNDAWVSAFLTRTPVDSRGHWSLKQKRSIFREY